MFKQIYELIKSNKLWSFMIFLISISPFLLYYSNFKQFGLSPEQEVWGQFGDYIGGLLNPIFAFLSFILVNYTIYLQIKNNKNQEDSRKLEHLENKITRIFNIQFPSRIKLGNSGTSMDVIIDLKKVINNYYFENTYRIPEDRKISNTKFDSIYINEETLFLELTNLSNIFNLFENEILRLDKENDNEHYKTFYKKLYSGDVHLINQVVTTMIGKGFSINGITWFSTIEENKKLYPVLF
ncbi:hypothetical protein [Leptospira sp. 'Mane']|uniref:hypothetical protein n=1 Tax=Leptospira sp. 'Mane' TaxID=3387407 RepID=UPI00398A7389